jgi:hypothetical protein
MRIPLGNCAEICAKPHPFQPLLERRQMLRDAVFHDLGAMANRAQVAVDLSHQGVRAMAEFTAHRDDAHRAGTWDGWTEGIEADRRGPRAEPARTLAHPAIILHLGR